MYLRKELDIFDFVSIIHLLPFAFKRTATQKYSACRAFIMQNR